MPSHGHSLQRDISARKPSEEPDYTGQADHALVVGIDWYPGLADLHGAQNDARAFRDWLVDPKGGGVPHESVQTILSEQFPKPESLKDAQPVVSRVDQAFGLIVRQGAKSNSPLGRRLYIFLAGHGFARNIDASNLLTAEASRDASGFYIPGRDYADWIRRASMFSEVVLIMDCCAEPRRHAPLREPPWDDPPRTIRPVSHAYAFAARWGGKAREKHVDQFGKVHGLFTAALLEGLKGSAAIGSGAIRSSDLEQFVLNYLPKLAVEDYTQPHFDYQSGPSEIVFVNDASTPLAELVIHVAGAWPKVEVSRQDKAVAVRYNARDHTWTCQVAPGLYSVRYTDGNTDPRVVEVLDTRRVIVTLEI